MPENDKELCFDDRSLLDARIRRLLPAIVPICILFSLLSIIIDPPSRFGLYLVRICLPYVPAFSLLGVYVMAKMRHNRRYSFAYTFPRLMGVLLVFSLLSLLYHDYFHPVNWISILPLGDELLINYLLIFLQLLLVFTIIVTTAFGVLGVIVAYFRHYMVRIINSLKRVKNDGTDKGALRANIWVFDIPSIIDIHDVELNPIGNKGTFPEGSFRSMVTAMLVLSIILVSYIFLNPFFILELQGWEMAAVGIIITFFVPVFIVPWSITRDLGVTIKSQARDYQIWTGMKKRLYQSFIALGVVFLLVGLVIYLVEDLAEVAYIYMGYFLFSICLASIYSFVYFNFFQREFCQDIVRKYEADGDDCSPPS